MTVNGTPIGDATVPIGERVLVAGTLVRVEGAPDYRGRPFPGVASVTISDGDELNLGGGIVRQIGGDGGFQTEVSGIPFAGSFPMSLRAASGERDAAAVELGDLVVSGP